MFAAACLGITIVGSLQSRAEGIEPRLRIFDKRQTLEVRGILLNDPSEFVFVGEVDVYQ